jgi:cyclic beta-1,2-glucan synthetase
VAELAETRDPELATKCKERVALLHKSIEASCWDGEWYLRGFFDNGSPLGSHKNTEARIDSLPQSWAVIAGGGDAGRAQTAMNAANRELVKDSERVVLLFTPPFDRSTPHPGYIMGYPPGIRENGGQYTHGSLWLAMAWARLGQGAQAVRLLQLMNPVEHCRTPQDVEHYRGEPYVSAADVYYSALQTGRSGWTWYTGSAAWMYKIWVEDVLGLQRRGNSLTVRPAIPPEWPGFKASWRFGKSLYEISVVRTSDGANDGPNDGANDGPRVETDGKVMSDGNVSLLDDGATRHVTVFIPAAQ